jgi:hypothetical protein
MFVRHINPNHASMIVECDRGAPNAAGVYRQVGGAGTTYPDFFHCEEIQYLQNPLGADGWPRMSGAGDRIVWADGTNGFGDVVQAVTLDLSGLGVVNNSIIEQDQMSFTVPTFAANANGADIRSPAISLDGSWVVAEAEGVGPEDVGIIEANLDSTGNFGKNERVDVGPGGAPTDPIFIGNSDIPVGHPQVSGDGTKVVFDADNGNNFYSYPDVYAVTVDTVGFGNQRPTPVTASVVVSGLADHSLKGGAGDGAFPAISADGRYVAFVTDRNGMTDAPAVPDTQLSFESCLYMPQIGLSASGFAAGAAPAAAGPRPAAAVPVRPAAAPPSPLPSPSGSGGPGPTRTACQVVVRDLIADAARAASNPPRALLPAELASPHVGACKPSTGGRPCIGNNDSENPVSLSADGAQVAYDSNASDLVNGDTNFRSGNDPAGGFPGTDAFVRTWTPTLTANPVNFGDVLLGHSSSQPLTFTVTGFGPITIDTITVGGTDQGDFTVTTNCTPPGKDALHENDPCTAQVIFTPGGPGPRSGTIDVFAPGKGTPLTPTISIPVTGTGSGTPAKIPQFSATPDPLTFGSHIPLKTPGLTRTATITNPGSGLLTVTSATVLDGSVPGAHSDYTVDFSDCAGGVAHLATCQILVTWVGHAVGTRPATVQLVDNAPGGLNLITVRANVPKPTLTVNPGVSPTGRVVTVSGLGFAPKRLVDIVVVDQNESATVKTDAQGKFSTGLVLFPNGDEGPRTVTAHSHGASATIAAEGPLLIVLGSLDSPTLVIRH